MIVEIMRLEHSEQGVIGVMKIDKKVFCHTLELPWAENKINISCIPAKQYTCVKIKTDKVNTAQIGKTFMVKNVIGRSGILFHVGNTTVDTLGCVLLGSRVGHRFDRVRSIFNSWNTFKKFMKKFENENYFSLTITEVF